MERLKELLCYKNDKTGHKIHALEESMTAFSHVTGIPVTLFSSSGRKLWTVLEERKTCAASREYGQPESNCTHALVSAMNISLNLGEVYTFKCRSGLINLCYALVLESRLQGFLIAGPVAMGNNRGKVIANFTKKAPPDQIDYPRLISLINDLSLYSPRDIAYVAALFFNSINSPLGAQNSANTRHQRFREQSEARYSGSSDIVKKAVSHIHAHYAEPLDLRSIADEIHVSHTYLSGLFRKETGWSVIHYLNRVRLGHAEELLSGTAMPIAEIATYTGFSSQSYFAKLFKAQYGMTPNTYRKRHDGQSLF